MDNETWDVALITDGEGSEYGPGLKCGSEVLPIKATERRSVIADDKMIRISGTKVKVGSGGCTSLKQIWIKSNLPTEKFLPIYLRLALVSLILVPVSVLRITW